MGWLPKRQLLSETGSPAYMRTRLAQSSNLESIANTDCPGRLIPEMPQASPSDIGHKELTPLPCPHNPGQICTPHLLTLPDDGRNINRNVGKHYDSIHHKLRKQYEYYWIDKHKHIKDYQREIWSIHTVLMQKTWKKEFKYVRYTNHLRYSLRCLHSNLIPDDLSLSQTKTTRPKKSQDSR